MLLRRLLGIRLATFSPCPHMSVHQSVLCPNLLCDKDIGHIGPGPTHRTWCYLICLQRVPLQMHSRLTPGGSGLLCVPSDPDRRGALRWWDIITVSQDGIPTIQNSHHMQLKRFSSKYVFRYILNLYIFLHFKH